MYRLFLAVRYLMTRPINLLGMGGITIGVWALVVVVSLFTGVIEVVERHVRDATGDVVVTELPPNASWARLEAALRDDPNVQSLAPRLLHHGLLLPPGERPPPLPLPGRSALHGGDQPFLFVVGIDPGRERETTGFGRWLDSDEIPPELRVDDPQQPFAERSGRPTVLLGLERMRREGLQKGQILVWTTARLSEDVDGNRRAERVQVELVLAGAYKTAHGGFDGSTALVAIDTVRQALHGGDADHVQEIAIRLADPEQLDASAARLGRVVGRTVEREPRAAGRTLTFREKNAQFLASVEHQRALMKIVLIVIMIVAAFLMLATLSMMVTEKIGDIGILTAMGGTPLGVTSVFLACGLVVTAVGVLLGLGGGTLTALYLEEIRQVVLWTFGVDLFPLEVYNLDRVPAAIDPLWLVQVALMALGTGFVVSVVPALRAARHDPLVSLRGT